MNSDTVAYNGKIADLDLLVFQSIEIRVHSNF
jgi:hypothetical protein